MGLFDTAKGGRLRSRGRRGAVGPCTTPLGAAPCRVLPRRERNYLVFLPFGTKYLVASRRAFSRSAGRAIGLVQSVLALAIGHESACPRLGPRRCLMSAIVMSAVRHSVARPGSGSHSVRNSANRPSSSNSSDSPTSGKLDPLTRAIPRISGAASASQRASSSRSRWRPSTTRARGAPSRSRTGSSARPGFQTPRGERDS